MRSLATTSMTATRVPVTTGFPLLGCCLIAIGLLNASIGNAAPPPDVLWLEPTPVKGDERPFAPRSIARRQGAIESADSKSLVMVPAREDKSVQVTASRVIWIEPGFEDSDTIAAIALFRQGQYAQSISPLLDSITRRPSVWRAQWLSMHLWQAAYLAERYPASLELVKQIDARPLPAYIIGGLPIAWIDGRLPASAVDAARSALAQPSTSAATQLVAASWLLGPSGDQAAVAALHSLVAQKERPLVAQLAETLLWVKTPPPNLRANRQVWKQQLEKLPLAMYAGPAALLADRLEAAGEREEALELFLSVALTPPRPHEITSQARSRAVSLLEQLGRPEEAGRLKLVSP
ncbi:MAG: hypothetical protein ACO1RT_20020 [Planctomycetaceae bacterium]